MNRVLAIMMALTILMISPITCFTDEEYKFDPAPLAIMFIDALSSIYTGDYEKVIELADVALYLNISMDLSYLHYRAWRIIRDIGLLASEASSSKNITMSMVYKFYRLKLEAREILSKYADELVKRIPDIATRYRYGEFLKNLLINLDVKLDEIYRLFIEHSYGLGMVRFKAVIPDVIVAGDVLEIEIVFETMLYIENIDVSLSSISYFNYTSIEIGSYIDRYTLYFKIPGTEQRYFKDVENPLNIYIVVHGVVNGVHVYGVLYRSINVMAEKPPIDIDIPTRVNPGENILFTIISRADEVLFSRVMFIGMENKEVYINESIVIEPGVNRYLLNTSSLTQGFYRLVVEIEPRGRYLSATYSITLAILGKTFDVSYGALNTVLVPPFNALLYLNLPEDPGAYIVMVKSTDGRTLYSENCTPGLYSVEIPLDTVWFIGYRRFIVEIIPLNEMYSVKNITVDVLILNYFSLTTITIFVFVLSSVSAEGLAYSFRRLNIFLERFRGYGRKLNIPYAVMLYHRLVHILSFYIHPPKPSETLREYYSRTLHVLRKLSSSLLKFILLYEKYLYSRERPSEKELLKAYKEVEEGLK